MSRIIGIAIAVMAVFLIVGILISAIYRARLEEEAIRCKDNLRQIGGFAVFHAGPPNNGIPPDANKYFPAGTVTENLKLTPDQRLSWDVLILAALDQGSDSVAADSQKGKKAGHIPLSGRLNEFVLDQPWNNETNIELAKTRVTQFICPGRIPVVATGQPGVTCYIGSAGLGKDTAEVPLEQAGKLAGVFRYDTRTPLEVIQEGDGLSSTISILETGVDIGPWAQGGPANVRSLALDQNAPLGDGRPFGGNHANKTFAAFADGSVRTLTDTAEPAIFRALLTIRGGEKEVGFEDR